MIRLNRSIFILPRGQPALSRNPHLNRCRLFIGIHCHNQHIRTAADLAIFYELLMRACGAINQEAVQSETVRAYEGAFNFHA